MPHELDVLADGSHAMARAEGTERTWHGLEHVIPADAPFDDWFARSGLNFEIRRSPVEFVIEPELGISGEMESRHVLFRSDTLAPLSVVSRDYNIVQPRQVLEFFRNLCETNHLKMETAGCIRGGLKFWAMASTGKLATVGYTDVIKQFVLMATSADSTMATTAKHTAMRVVCNNTFDAAVGNDEPAVRVRHSSVFNETDVKLNLGLMGDQFDHTISMADEMHRRSVTDEEVERFYVELLFEEFGEGVVSASEISQVVTDSRMVRQFIDGFRNGPGSEATVWGLFNGVTYTVDFLRGRSFDTRLDSAWFGMGLALKGKAWKKAMAMTL